MRRTLKKIVKKVTVSTPPPPPDRDLNQVDSPPTLPSWDYSPPTRRGESSQQARHSRSNYSVDSVTAFIREFDGSPPESEAQEFDSPPPRSAGYGSSDSAAYLLPSLHRRDYPPSGPVVGHPPPPQGRQSMSLWERRQRNPRSGQPSSSPPRVISPPPPDPSSRDLDDLPSAELRGMIEDYIDRRGAWRAARATEQAWQSQPSSSNSVPQGAPHSQVPTVAPAENLEDHRVTPMAEAVEETVTPRTITPSPFAFSVPSPGPSSGRHSTGTILGNEVPLVYADDPSHPTALEQAILDEWRYLESSIEFEDAIHAFAEATGFDLDAGMEVDEEPQLQQPEMHQPQAGRRLSVRALEDAAHAMAQATAPSRSTQRSPPSRQSSHSRSYLDIEDTSPIDTDEWAARPLPDLTSGTLTTTTPSEPPQLPMLNIPMISLSEAEFWGDLSFESASTAAEEPAPDPAPQDGLRRSTTLPPRRPERLDIASQTSEPEIDDDKTPTGFTLQQLQARAAIPPPSSHFRPNILRKLSEPLFRTLGARRRRNPFRSADLGRRTDDYMELLEESNTFASTSLDAASRVLATSPYETIKQTDPATSLKSSEPVGSSSKDRNIDSGAGALEDDDELGSFGDLLAQFPLPPQHRPPPQQQTPARAPSQSDSPSTGTQEQTPITPEIVQTPSTQPPLSRSTRTEPLSFAQGAMHTLTASPSDPQPLDTGGNTILRSPLQDAMRDSKRLRIRRRSSASHSEVQADPVLVDCKGKGKGKATMPSLQVDSAPKQEPAAPREDLDKTIRPSAAQMKRLKEFDSMLKGGETVKLSAKGRSASGKSEGVRRGGFF